MPNVDYDDSAFGFFLVALLGIFVGPASYYVVRRVTSFNKPSKLPYIVSTTMEVTRRGEVAYLQAASRWQGALAAAGVLFATSTGSHVACRSARERRHSPAPLPTPVHAGLLLASSCAPTLAPAAAV
jgi:hypothetical protein